jgi:predicted HTH transcriptional regulator
MDFTENQEQNDSTTSENQIRQRSLPENDHEYKKICACVRHYAEILNLLISDQPLSTENIVDNLGKSKISVLRDLKRLMKYDLVVKTPFEHHVLYCVNGNFNTLIFKVLDYDHADNR